MGVKGFVPNQKETREKKTKGKSSVNSSSSSLGSKGREASKLQR
jgi:hypothetical protein